MGIKQVDLYLVHMPTLLKDFENDWAAFVKIKEAGLAKYVSLLSECASTLTCARFGLQERRCQQL